MTFKFAFKFQFLTEKTITLFSKFFTVQSDVKLRVSSAFFHIQFNQS